MARVDRSRELLDRRAHLAVYKEVGDVQLQTHIFYPEGHQPGAGKACLVFFFGSKWDNGLVSQFAPQCVYFASRGAVAMAVDYRVSARHGTSPAEALADARSAFRWVRKNAEALGADASKVVGAGASGGAFLVAASAMLDGYDEPGEGEDGFSATPDAMVLYSPAVDTTPGGFGFERFANRAAAKRASLLRAVRKGLPPTLVFHGTADRVVPFTGVKRFCRKMRWKRNRCQLVPFEGQGHGFFNFNVDPRAYEATTTAADRFLVGLGFLDPSDELAEPLRLD
jgi:acetyl esterase/lipase